MAGDGLNGYHAYIHIGAYIDRYANAQATSSSLVECNPEPTESGLSLFNEEGLLRAKSSLLQSLFQIQCTELYRETQETHNYKAMTSSGYR